MKTHRLSAQSHASNLATQFHLSRSFLACAHSVCASCRGFGQDLFNTRSPQSHPCSTKVSSCDWMRWLCCNLACRGRCNAIHHQHPHLSALDVSCDRPELGNPISIHACRLHLHTTSHDPQSSFKHCRNHLANSARSRKCVGCVFCMPDSGRHGSFRRSAFFALCKP